MGHNHMYPITVFGLVTSISNDQDVVSWEPHAGAQGNSGGEVEQFEKAFHTIFDATTQIEKFGLFAHYPRVTVYPLAVYNSIRK